MPGSSEIPTPLPAATLILLREAHGGLQAYLVKRSPKSGFMAGLYVFPGGAVEDQDRDASLWREHGDLEPYELIEKFSGEGTAGDAAAFAVAAIRESIEEAGVFLAAPRDPSAADYDLVATLAQSALRPAGWLRELVAQGGWRLRFSSLHPWSRWITPELMKKRYDTLFFLAVMPEGQSCRPDAHETLEGVWVSPLRALRLNLSGDLPLSPPTLVTLQQLLPFNRLDALLTAALSRRWAMPTMPRLVALPQGVLILEPWDPAYRLGIVSFDPQRLAAAVLEAGAPFSRLWHSRGVWRPVAAG